MTEEEKKTLESAVQNFVASWAGILAMHQWNIQANFIDDNEWSFGTNIYDEIGQAIIEVPSNDVWNDLYPKCLYDMEKYIVFQLLRIKFCEKNIDRENLSYLAHCLVELKRRGDQLEQVIQSIQEKETAEPKKDEAKTEEEPELSFIVEDHEKESADRPE